MPLANTYSVGKITVTKNSVIFTGTGTLWKTAGLRDGDFVILNDMIGIIQGENTFGQPITSNTSGKFKRPWQGASGTYDYDMIFRSVDSRLTDNTQQVLEAIASGLLQSFGSVSAGNNKMPYFTGVSSVDVTALTAWARTLLAAANGDAAYGALGMVPDGSFPNRLKSVKPSVTDFNTVSENGWYWGSMATANTPDASASWYMEHINYGTSAYCVQYATIVGTTSPRTFTRKKSNNVWGSWETTMLPILGTVSQSGGVPTGAIIQSGNNASGSFVRLADGTQICWGKAEVIHSNSNSNTGRLGGEWAYPAAFSTSNNEVFMNTPIQQAANWTGITGAQSGRGSARAGGAASSATGATLSIFFDSGTVSTTEGRVQNISLMVIGRWH